MIVITRPQEEAHEFAKEVEALGFQTHVEPMLSVHNIEFEPPALDPFQGLLFTSANAVRAFCERVAERELPAFAVGTHTAQTCLEQGFKHVHDAQGAAEDLVRLVVQKTADVSRPYLYLRGKDISQSVDDMLAAHGITVHGLIVYETVMSDHLSKPFCDALSDNEIEAVTFFSKRTVENFLNLIDAYDLHGQLSAIKALSISETVLEYVQSHQWQGTYKSDSPDRESMLALIKRVCS